MDKFNVYVLRVENGFAIYEYHPDMRHMQGRTWIAKDVADLQRVIGTLAGDGKSEKENEKWTGKLQPKNG